MVRDRRRPGRQREQHADERHDERELTRPRSSAASLTVEPRASCSTAEIRRSMYIAASTIATAPITAHHHAPLVRAREDEELARERRRARHGERDDPGRHQQRRQRGPAARHPAEQRELAGRRPPLDRARDQEERRPRSARARPSAARRRRSRGPARRRGRARSGPTTPSTNRRRRRGSPAPGTRAPTPYTSVAAASAMIDVAVEVRRLGELRDRDPQHPVRRPPSRSRPRAPPSPPAAPRGTRPAASRGTGTAAP